MIRHVAEGHSRRGAGDILCKGGSGAARRHCDPREQSSSPGAGPHQALHTPRHLTAVFRVEKHALRLGASAHYLPTNVGPSPRRPGSPWKSCVYVVRQTHHTSGVIVVYWYSFSNHCTRKCDGAPRRRVGKGWSWELGHTRPTGCRGQARAESTADTEADAREMASLPGRWMTPSQATPPRSGGPAGKGCSPPRRDARSIL